MTLVSGLVIGTLVGSAGGIATGGGLTTVTVGGTTGGGAIVGASTGVLFEIAGPKSSLSTIGAGEFLAGASGPDLSADLESFGAFLLSESIFFS